jgi:hypothetical protein
MNEEPEQMTVKPERKTMNEEPEQMTESAPPLTTSENTILDMEAEMAQRRKVLDWVRRNAAKLDSLPFAPRFWNGFCDYDSLKHTEVVQVILAFPCGHWLKESMGETVNYIGHFDGVTVRCWAGEAPPSCQIVEEKVLVPERWVPERWETVRRLVCPGGVE